MSTEITIFDIPDKEVIIDKSQKELEYDALEKASRLEGYHFKNFYRLSILNESEQIPNSNISAVLCKYVIQFTQPVITRLTDVKHFYIALQNERNVLAYEMSTDMYFSIPMNEHYKVIGIRLPTLLLIY